MPERYCVIRFVHKRRPQSGGEGCPVRAFCGKEVFRYRRPHFLVQKTSVFRNLFCVRTDKGLNLCRHFAYKGRGQFFVILCGRLLPTKAYGTMFD